MLVLLDRDGVINRDAAEGILSVENFQLLPRVPEAVAMLTDAGFAIAICTNQSAIAKGTLSEETLDAIHAKMKSELAAAGGRIDKIYVAPDDPAQPSERRKPGPGMLREALQHFGASPAKTPMVGDMLRDLEAAHKAGCPRILVRSGKGASQIAKGIPPALEPVTIVEDLYAAAHHICEVYR